jgi:hypothetical protein
MTKGLKKASAALYARMSEAMWRHTQKCLLSNVLEVVVSHLRQRVALKGLNRTDYFKAFGPKIAQKFKKNLALLKNCVKSACQGKKQCTITITVFGYTKWRHLHVIMLLQLLFLTVYLLTRQVWLSRPVLAASLSRSLKSSGTNSFDITLNSTLNKNFVI